MSNANSLSPFWGKVNQFIIPVTHFKSPSEEGKSLKGELEAKSSNEYVPQLMDIDQTSKPAPEKTQTFNPTEIKIKKNNLKIGVSSLSLSSIALKKEAERISSSKKNEFIDSEDKFSQEKLSKLWKTYTHEKNN